MSEGSLDVAREILGQVRSAGAIHLRDIDVEPAHSRATADFLCPRSTQPPNPEIAELTGGQLNDVTMQMSYALAGLLIVNGIDVLGVDFETFKRNIFAHRLNVIRMEIVFHRHSIAGIPFEVSASMDTMANGRLYVSRKRTRYVRVSLSARQHQDGGGGAAVNTFRARLSSSLRLLEG